MIYGHFLALAVSISVLAGCSLESTPRDVDKSATAQKSSINTQSANSQNVNNHSAVKRLKARIILYTHTDFNQSQVEAMLLPLLPKDSVLYLRKLATQGHVLVIQAPGSDSLQQKIKSISALDDVKLLEQDAILTIKDQ